MASVIILAVTAVLIGLFVKLYNIFKDKLNFYVTGLDSKFSLSEIGILWKLSQATDLEEPKALFWSLPALERCIAFIIDDARAKGTENDSSVQLFLSKLYKYRTKVELESENKRGLDSSRFLDPGQKLRIILPGKGVFTSKIISCGRDLIVKLPLKEGSVRVPAEQWEKHPVSVYLWRKGDAGYVFDTTVRGSGVFTGQTVLYLAHSDELLRSQKRRSIRTECHIIAQLYILREAVTDFSKVESQPGYKCLIEDISEDGALVRIGGKGVNNVQMKLQFPLEDSLIIMYGVVRAVEYNEAQNQSRLHFECIHIEQNMRNAILTFVYKVLPDAEREAAEAMTQLEEDEKEDQKEESVEGQVDAALEVKNANMDAASNYSENNDDGLVQGVTRDENGGLNIDIPVDADAVSELE